MWSRPSLTLWLLLSLTLPGDGRIIDSQDVKDSAFLEFSSYVRHVCYVSVLAENFCLIDLQK